MCIRDRGTPYLTQLADFLEALVAFTEIHAPLLSEVERGGLLRVDAPLNVPHFWQFMTVSALLRAAARRGELVDGLDLDYVGEALLAPLQIDIFRYQRDARGYSLELSLIHIYVYKRQRRDRSDRSPR